MSESNTEEDRLPGRVTKEDQAISKAYNELFDGVMNRAEIARGVDKSDKVIADYLEGRRAIPLKVCLDMAKLLDLGIDSVVRRAGLLPERLTVEEAMDSDQRLPGKHRKMAKSVYQTFLD